MKKIIFIFCWLVIGMLSVESNAQFIVVTDPLFAKAMTKKFPAFMSADSLSLDTVAAAGFTGYLQLQNGGYSNVSELRYFKSITKLQLYNTPLAHLPDMTGFSSLTYVDLRGTLFSSISELYPIKNQINVLLLRQIAGGQKINDCTFLTQFPNLTTIQFSNFDARILPDFSSFPGLAALNLTNNKLTFKDLLPLTIYSGLTGGLTLMPQNKISNDTSITVMCSQPLSITIPTDYGISGISYTFIKDGVVLQSSTSNTYQVTKCAVSDAGTYKVEIRSSNPFFGSDSLVTGNFNVDIIAPTGCQNLFSPNNDGQDDELPIEGFGEAVIRNKQGSVVRKITLPGSWDGTDQHGNPVDIGLYSISIGKYVSTVTVLR